MKKTPVRFLLPPSSRKLWSRSNGFQIASPKIITEDEETIIPMNEVTANPIGMVKSWDHSAFFGFLANREKSGLLCRMLENVSTYGRTWHTKMSIAKLAMEDMIPVTIPQA